MEPIRVWRILRNEVTKITDQLPNRLNTLQAGFSAISPLRRRSPLVGRRCWAEVKDSAVIDSSRVPGIRVIPSFHT